MKFFIDTANLEQIQEAYDLGVLDGVTTNPSLMAKEGSHSVKYSEVISLLNLLQISCVNKKFHTLNF